MATTDLCRQTHENKMCLLGLLIWFDHIKCKNPSIDLLVLCDVNAVHNHVIYRTCIFKE